MREWVAEHLRRLHKFGRARTTLPPPDVDPDQWQAELFSEAVELMRAPPSASEKFEISAQRRAIVVPLLRERRLSIYRWEKLARVGKGVGQRYLDGTRKPRKEQDEKLASPLGLSTLP